MSARRISIVLVASIALLVGAGAAWAVDADTQDRSDLTGDAVVVPATTTAPRTSVAPPDGRSASGGATTPPPASEPAPPTSILTSTSTFTATPPADPERLSIPALGVDAPIVPVGLEPDGTMEIPGVTEAGWFEPGPRPGAPFGSAVIAAHVDYGGAAGVFFDLRTLEVGSEVTVTDDAGEPLTYIVTERFQVDKQELPVDELFRPGGEPTLTLITCGGAFDRGASSYEDNIVVRAVPR